MTWFDGLMIGITIGLLLGLLLHLVSNGLYRRILIGKADHQDRTPEKIGDGFYYIVPEREYVHQWSKP